MKKLFTFLLLTFLVSCQPVLTFAQGSFLVTDLGAVLGISSGGTGTITDSAARKSLGVFSIIDAYHQLGSKIKGYPMNLDLSRTTSSNFFTSRNLACILMIVPKADTIKGVAWIQIAKGAYAPSNNNRIGLDSIKFGTDSIFQIASTVNDSNLWQTAANNTWAIKAFSTPIYLPAGVYVLEALFSGTITTSVSIAFGASVSSNAAQTADFTTGIKAVSTLALQNDLVSLKKLGSNTTNVTYPAFFLY